jgi:hypothetical protein
MPKVSGIEKGFAHYGAKLTNRMWAVSAELDDAVVLSLWQHKFKKGLVYEDNLGRWSGLGNTQFRKHLQLAFDRNLPIRLVIASTDNPAGVDRGEDASAFDNTFYVRPELVGKVETLVGDDFTIRFTKVSP